MKTFKEYINKPVYQQYMDKNWSWNYTWTANDTADLDMADPTEEDVENAMSEIVRELGLESGAPGYKLPDYITIDFTTLGNTDLVPYSFHVDSYSDDEEWGNTLGKDYTRENIPQIKNNKIIARYRS